MRPDYKEKLAEQVQQYATVEVLHRLPAIRDYWFNKFIAPRVHQVFYSQRKRRGNLYADFFEDILRKSQESEPTLVSLGAGDCKHETAVVKQLRARELSGFKLECLELSEQLLEIGKQIAEKEGVADLMVFSQTDINQWRPCREYKAVMTHQALHHFVNLENIFSSVIQCIGTTGIFVTCDVIGRNGHLLWPESLRIIESLWASLTADKKFHHQLNKHCEMFPNHDCSTKGFEGVRAQDILPLLVDNFRFEYFLGYGGLTDPFVGRSFGDNWTPESVKDQTFIDAVQLMNDTLYDVGYLKPTRMIAVLRHPNYHGQGRFFRHWTPEFCVRAAEPSGFSDSTP